MADSDGSSFEHSEDDLSRPNRFQGAASTWLTLTEEERGLAASLDQLRNDDLSIHLYNAFQLRKRAKEAADSDEGKQKLENLYPHIPEDERTFDPPKVWTAWPMPPDEVPKRKRKSEEDIEDEKVTYKMKEVKRPSSELEDVLVGTILKQAKERFNARKPTDEPVDIVEDEDNEDKLSAENMQDSDTDQDSLQSSLGNVESKPIKGETEMETVLQPVISADDEASAELLRPSIRHMLSRLDSVLFALHQARKIAGQYSQSAPNTDDEKSQASLPETPKTPTRDEDGSQDSDIEKMGSPNNKSTGSFRNLVTRSKVAEPTDNQSEDTPAPAPIKKKRGGRPKKIYPRLEGETDHEFLIRIARLQKRPLPSFASPAKTKRSRSRATTQESQDPPRVKRERDNKLALRDWSEVLGSAALVGFPPAVIARATRRCADLFGESMEMRVMPEMSLSEHNPDTLELYKPEGIHDYGVPDTEPSDSDMDGSENEASTHHLGQMHQLSYLLRDKPYSSVVFCPIDDCPKKKKHKRFSGFGNKNTLRLHLRNGHDISEDKIDEYVVASGDEMDGAVHLDGYLRPVKRYWGVRGPYLGVQGKAGVGQGDDDKMEDEQDDGDEMDVDDDTQEGGGHETKEPSPESDDN